MSPVLVVITYEDDGHQVEQYRENSVVDALRLVERNSAVRTGPATILITSLHE